MSPTFVIYVLLRECLYVFLYQPFRAAFLFLSFDSAGLVDRWVFLGYEWSFWSLFCANKVNVIVFIASSDNYRHLFSSNSDLAVWHYFVFSQDFLIISAVSARVPAYLHSHNLS